VTCLITHVCSSLTPFCFLAELAPNDPEGHMLFMVACWGGHVGAVDLFLDKKVGVADLNRQSTVTGESALHVACGEYGSVAVVKRLLDLGADKSLDLVTLSGECCGCRHRRGPDERRLL
jgi:ankyrin repeat protein